LAKILIVDDDPDVITSIKIGLNKLSNNYDIIGANSGLECIKLLKLGAKPDIILLDIMMPKMNGWEVYDHMQTNREWADIPVIFVTALDDRETLQKGMQTNTYCIKKPFNLGELKEKIERVLSGETFF
jgi:two-component system, sensor histidine kinase and response regulator